MRRNGRFLFNCFLKIILGLMAFGKWVWAYVYADDFLELNWMGNGYTSYVLPALRAWDRLR